ncbi:MAG TPA: S9 family peptidase [Terriglobales bacterium]|nr:S9 family peptidase [Terriglobales bacterium]
MKNLIPALLLTMTTFVSSTLAADGPANTTAKPPVAKKVAKETKIHGDVLKDDYFWLREKSNPEVAAYLEAENAYTDALMAPTKPLQDALYQELLSHIKETDVNVPYPNGPYFYYSRTEKGKQYPIFGRKKSLEATEEVYLDQNQLAVGEKFMSLGTLTVSDDSNWLAYSTDNTGFRQYKLRFKDLRTGKLSPEVIEKVTSVAWANDNKTVFYTVEDHAKRSYRAYRHLVGQDPAKDKLLYEETDEMFNVGLGKGRSKRFIFLEIGSHTTSEVRYLPADQPLSDWKTIAPRIAGQEYDVEDRDSLFYIRTNHGGRNFGISTAPIGNADRKEWKSLIPHRSDVMVEGFTMFANFMVLREREGGLQHLRITDLRNNQTHRVKMPDAVYSVGLGPNLVWNTGTLRYVYQSPITPNSVFDYDMEKKQSRLLKETEVPGGFDRNNYQVERIYATAPDGVKVPLSVFYKKGVKRDGTAPLYLYSYGSYGSSIPLSFSSNRLALLDRGIVYALAHIRGGGDLGKPWHDAGRMMNKMNTFTDFIACAEKLIADKYTAKGNIVIEGGSAGGLLMGAVTNLRPDLWKAVISKVPFVDVMNTMLDASLPLTVSEYEEWGNPNKPDDYAYMRKYSPYDNLEAKPYPTILVKTSFNDSQVMYWEPAKYVAKLRTLKPAGDKNVLMLKTNMAAGHGGASGRYDFLHDVAFDYAFILQQFGMEK